MKSLLLTAIFAISVILQLPAQSSEKRSLDDFSGIAVSAGIEAVLVRGNKNSIDITAKGIELDKVSSKISRDVLKVGIDQKWWSNMSGWNKKRKVQVVITYDSELEYISASSGASVEADHTISSVKLELNSSSGADLEIDVECKDLEIDLSSGAQMDLSGEAKYISIDLSSGATLDAFQLEGESVDVDGSSGSSARISVSEELNADVSSGASVRYKGSPSLKDIDKSSGGSVKRA